MKKFICGTMAAVMAASLAGCAKTESAVSSQSTVEATDTQSTTAKAGSSYTGKVTEISAVSLTLETEDSGNVTIPLSDDTAFTRGGMGAPGGDAPASRTAAETSRKPLPSLRAKPPAGSLPLPMPTAPRRKSRTTAKAAATGRRPRKNRTVRQTAALRPMHRN